ALFEHGVVHAHDHAAGDLRFARQLVDQHPAVLHRVDVSDFHHAGFGVDHDLGDLATADLAGRHIRIFCFAGHGDIPVPAGLHFVHAEFGAEFLPTPTLALGVFDDLAGLNLEVLRIDVQLLGDLGEQFVASSGRRPESGGALRRQGRAAAGT